MGTLLDVAARSINKTARVIAFVQLITVQVQVFSYYHFLCFTVLPFKNTKTKTSQSWEKVLKRKYQSSLQRVIFLILACSSKIIFSTKKFMFPDQNLFLCFQLSIQVKGICQNCDLVVFKFIKKSRKYSEAMTVIRRFLLIFISPWSYKN